MRKFKINPLWCCAGIGGPTGGEGPGFGGMGASAGSVGAGGIGGSTGAEGPGFGGASVSGGAPGFGGASPGGGPSGSDADFAAINAEIAQTMTEAANKGISFVDGLKAFSKGFVKGLPVSSILGLVLGLNSLSEAQQQAAIDNVKAANPGISDAMAADLAQGFASTVGQGVATGDIGGPGDVEQWVNTVSSAIQQLPANNVKTDFGTGGQMAQNNPDAQAEWAALENEKQRLRNHGQDPLSITGQYFPDGRPPISDEAMARIKEIEQQQAALTGDMTNQGGSDSGGDGQETNYTYDKDDPEIWTDYVNSFYDQALKEFRNQSQQYADNTKGYSDKTQGLLDQNQGYLDTLMGEIEGNKTSNLPTMSRMVGGQEVTWVPKPNRDAAQQDTNAALGLMDRQDKFINTGMNTAETDFRNKQALASLGNPTLNYLEKLKELVNQEQIKSAADKGVALDKDRLEQNEPGMLDYIKGFGTAADSLGGILKMFG